ncbi:MAG: hypothetical protein GY928_00160, partial [Colwellia sp.]|nr:hypothetical protein [Colwellia sp.]
MKACKFILISIFYLSLSFNANANPDDDTTQNESDIKESPEVAETAADQKAEEKLDQFGFGPAFYVIKYDDEVLADSKDVSVRGDGTLSTKGTDYSTSLGLELHYDFSFGRTVKCFGTKEECKDVSKYELTTAHRLSPFLGLYDVDNGINGIAIGLVYGYIKQHKNDKNPITLNAGIGWTVHKNRL